MNILKKLTNKNLKLNKKRTIGTIIGIILSTAMICAVATMVTSFRKTLITTTIQNDGYYHLVLQDITADDFQNVKDNKNFSKIRPIYILGYADLKQEDDESASLIEIDSASKQNLIDLKYNIYEGRYPNNNEEIILSRIVMKYYDLKIGDKVSFDIGNYDDNWEITDKNTKNYTVVGSLDTYNFNGFTTDEKSNDIDVYMTLAKPSTYKKSISQLLEIDNWKNYYDGAEEPKYTSYLNTYLLHLEVFSFSSETTNMLLTIAGIIIVIIMIASIFCIRNSFAISTTEKMQMFGMLSSVGATKKQIKKSVIYEGLVLGSIGIPLGVISGLLGDFILFKVVNFLLKDVFTSAGTNIIFTPSIIACIIASLLAFLTIFLSSLSSARKASKVSPIENLKLTNDIKIKASKLKTPKIIEKVFKTGGVLAVKNLKRSKKKYRTTVISLTVSIFVFIALSYFVGEGFNMTDNMYTDYGYDIILYNTNIHSITEDTLKVVKGFKEVEKMYVTYSLQDEYFVSKDLDNINFKNVSSYSNSCDGEEEEDCEYSIYLNTVILNDETFKDYVSKNNLKYDEVKDKALLYDVNSYAESEDNRTFKYQANDKIPLFDEMKETTHEYVIGALCTKPVYGYETISNPTVIFNKDYFDSTVLLSDVYVVSSNPDKTVENIQKYDKKIELYNYEESVRTQRNLIIVISIFLYGFITLITLIGVTNIFNTITSNMELRSREFAMLKSIGMTKKEFNRMITLETIFYCAKSLIYGTVLGLLASYFIYRAFSKNMEITFSIPYKAILISIIFVFVIVYVIMKYSIKKINKQNTIETIRKETV